MGNNHLNILVLVYLSLLHFVVSFGEYENISDCRLTRKIEERMTFKCGDTDNSRHIFGKDTVKCGYHHHYDYKDVLNINFQNCLFRDIDIKIIQTIKKSINLREFNISDVGLVNITIENLQSLPIKRFNASHNQLTAIPTRLFEIAERLRVVDFSFNAIEQVPSNTFINASNMESLDLTNNHLNLLGDHLFDSVRNLEYLSLSYNPIGNLKVDTFAYLTKLKHLNLRRTNISNIMLGTFSFQPELISLDLSENSLKSLNFDIFLPSMRHLRSLNLDDNQLLSLSGFTNALFPKLRLLGIQNNEFLCSYLGVFMKSVNWDKIEIAVDPNAVDPQKPNIRGINCDNVNGTNYV